MFIYISISTIQKTRYTNYSVTQIHSKCILHKIFKYKQYTYTTHNLDEEIKLLENSFVQIRCRSKASYSNRISYLAIHSWSFCKTGKFGS